MTVKEKSLLYKFAFSYSDANRTTLNQFKKFMDLARYLKKQDLTNRFVAYANKNGFTGSYNDIETSGPYMENELEAYITRNFFDNAGFYPLINRMDKTILKALDVLHSDHNLARLYRKK